MDQNSFWITFNTIISTVTAGMILLGWRYLLQDHLLIRKQDLKKDFLQFSKEYWEDEGYKKRLGALDAEIEKVAEITKIVKNIETDYNQKSANYSQKLNTELENHKDKLEKIRSNFQIEYTKLHNDRADVVVELYKKLVRLNLAMKELMAKIKPIKESFEDEENIRIENAYSKYNEFILFALENRIFFSEETFKLIDDIRKAYHNITWDYTEKYQYQNGGYSNEFMLELYEQARSASDRFEKEVPQLMTILENELQRLIGIYLKNGEKVSKS